MKKLLSYIKNSAFLPICAGIAAIQPQLSAQIQELYFNDVTDNNSTYISDISNWYTDLQKQLPLPELSTATKTAMYPVRGSSQ